MANTWHLRWIRQGIESWNQRRKQVSFKPDLRGACFQELLTEGGDSDFSHINLNDSDLRGADLSGLSFAFGKFRRAQLSDARMSNANFTMADFYRSDLSRSDGSNSKFWGAKFRKSNLTDMLFENSIIDNAVFIGTDITYGQISSAKSNNSILLSDVYLDYSTSVPARLKEQLLIDEIREDLEKLEEAGVDVQMSVESSSGTEYSEGVIYTVMYATNRKPYDNDPTGTWFSADRDDTCHFGLCQVEVPKSHKVGQIGTSLWRRLIGKRDSLRVVQIIELNEEIFWSHWSNALLVRSKISSSVIFVHGFNNSFKDAVIRAAQLGYDLGIGAGIGLFSWPSKGSPSPRSYSSDEASAEASKYHLADFIINFIENSKSDSVSIIAHSMGCRCVLLAMEIISLSRPDLRKRVNNLILAAADVDQGMMRDLGSAALSVPIRSTSYASMADRAIELSHWLHRFPRVGLCPPVYVMSGLDTVVVGGFDLTLFGHGYFAECRDVLSDIYHLILSSLPPDERFTLINVKSNSGAYWKLRD